MFQALLTTVLFAMCALCAERSTHLLSATVANLARLVLATLLLAAWAHTLGQGVLGPGLPWLFVSGVVGFGLGDLALYAAFPRIGSRLTMLLCLCVSAPLGALMEWFWLGTGLTASQMFWGGVILVGVGVALAPDAASSGTRRDRVLGTVMGLIAALGQAGGAVLTRKAFDVAHRAGRHIDGATAAYQRILGGVLLTLVVLIVGRTLFKGHAQLRLRDPSHQWRQAWPWVVTNALCGPALGVACFQWALAVEKTGLVLAIVATTPLVLIPFTYVINGERPGGRSLVGAALAVLGAAVLAHG